MMHFSFAARWQLMTSLLVLILLFPLRSEPSKRDRSKAASGICRRRCGGRESDMSCPRTEPLDELLDALTAQGYEGHFDEVDARLGQSGLSVCTNCGARGRFTYTGMKNEKSYRAFWTAGLARIGWRCRQSALGRSSFVGCNLGPRRQGMVRRRAGGLVGVVAARCRRRLQLGSWRPCCRCRRGPRSWLSRNWS